MLRDERQAHPRHRRGAAHRCLCRSRLVTPDKPFVERGTYAELMKSDGMFRRLAERQVI